MEPDTTRFKRDSFLLTSVHICFPFEITELRVKGFPTRIFSEGPTTGVSGRKWCDEETSWESGSGGTRIVFTGLVRLVSEGRDGVSSETDERDSVTRSLNSHVVVLMDSPLNHFVPRDPHKDKVIQTPGS